MPVKVYLRDFYGKRFVLEWESEEIFMTDNLSEYDNADIYQILLVEWGNNCLFNALVNEFITFEDLRGFFG